MWVLVHWVRDNKTSVMPISAIIHDEMLKNTEQIGRIKYMTEEREPVNGWRKYLGRVLFHHGK